MEIAEWLQGLGLGQYAPAFAENAVRWDVVPRLTGDDLKDCVFRSNVITDSGRS